MQELKDITDYPHLAEADTRRENGNAMWKAILAEVINRAIEFRYLLTRDNLEAIMERVGEELLDDAAGDLEQLSDAGFEGRIITPEEASKKLDAESERLYDAFRVKPLDGAKLLLDALRPVATNPATWGDL